LAIGVEENPAQGLCSVEERLKHVSDEFGGE